MALEHQQTMSVEGYFKLEEIDTEHRYEYVDGYVYMMSGGTADQLQDAHGGRIPIVHPEAFGNKAADLVAEPYFFQWAASPDGLLGHFNMQDVASLLRFLFHGLTLITRAGEPIRIAPHLLRHVQCSSSKTDHSRSSQPGHYPA